MRIAFSQIDIEPGQPFKNLKKAKQHLQKAIDQGAQLILFPEMLLPGYLIADLWDRNSFIKEILSAQDALIQTSNDIAIAFGGLGIDPNKKGEDGRIRKFNAFYLAYQGKLIPPESSPYPFSIKTLLPNYREFDDSRYFYDNRKLALETGETIENVISPHILNFKHSTYRIGGILCEDSWGSYQGISPISILAHKKSDFIVNLSSSPYTQGKSEKRIRLFEEHAKQFELPILYCNHVGIQNNGKSVYTFDGDSSYYSKQGKKTFSLPPFLEVTHTIDIKNEEHPPIVCNSQQSHLLQALIYGTKKFLELTNIQKVVIGISGGIDSALAATIYSKILEPDQLLLVNMPSRFNSELTKSAAQHLAENLKCLNTIASIQNSVDHSIQQFENLEISKPNGNIFKLNVEPFVSENIQARDRSSRVLAGIAACFNGVFTCNANKSETAVGYSTLYGDHAGFFANLADLWKGQIYELSYELNQLTGFDLIPKSIIEMKPAAELSKKQNPEKGQGDPFFYPYHDALFRSWVEDWERKSPEEILEAYQNNCLDKFLQCPNGTIQKVFHQTKHFIDDLERWWTAYNGLGLAKRIQAPPILALSRRAFGFDHRESQTKVLWTKEYLRLKDKLLKTNI